MPTVQPVWFDAVLDHWALIIISNHRKEERVDNTRVFQIFVHKRLQCVGSTYHLFNLFCELLLLSLVLCLECIDCQEWKGMSEIICVHETITALILAPHFLIRGRNGPWWRGRLRRKRSPQTSLSSTARLQRLTAFWMFRTLWAFARPFKVLNSSTDCGCLGELPQDQD